MSASNSNMGEPAALEQSQPYLNLLMNSHVDEATRDMMRELRKRLTEAEKSLFTDRQARRAAQQTVKDTQRVLDDIKRTNQTQTICRDQENAFLREQLKLANDRVREETAPVDHYQLKWEAERKAVSDLAQLQAWIDTDDGWKLIKHDELSDAVKQALRDCVATFYECGMWHDNLLATKTACLGCWGSNCFRHNDDPERCACSQCVNRHSLCIQKQSPDAVMCPIDPIDWSRPDLAPADLEYWRAPIVRTKRSNASYANY
ncbi:hypothetical protein N0V95_004040 [Ascochyta clinopodiicola]|nr:hypothetical protein N0V95_004040 [Ascochyta clinopodiicola]